MKIIVTGATGLVGAEVIRQAIADESIREIIALSRKPLSLTHPKLKTINHPDFLDYTAVADVFRDADACLWCLGVSQSQVTKEQYHTITYDYTVRAANAMLVANPTVTFLFVSGEGADSTEKSKTLFARVKGKTENALQKLPFKKLIIARPGGIKPIHKNPNTSFFNKLMIPLFPVMEFIMPSMVISSVELAKALLHLVKAGSDKVIVDNKELKRIEQMITA
jgi:uncharacterized protein YbjT (DUF2867 family)